MGGVVYAIGSGSPEVAIDANSEQQKKLYVTGGTSIFDGLGYTNATIIGGSSVSLSSYTGGGKLV